MRDIVVGLEILHPSKLRRTQSGVKLKVQAEEAQLPKLQIDRRCGGKPRRGTRYYTSPKQEWGWILELIEGNHPSSQIESSQVTGTPQCVGSER